MRATLSVHALKRMLGVAVRAVERRTTIPILECLRIWVDSSSIHAQGTNLDVWIDASAPAAGCQDGAVCVSRRFVDFVRALPNFDLVTVALIDGRLVVETPDGRASFITVPVTDFPTPSEVEPLAAFAMKSAELRGCIERVARFISTEETRYYLNGICFTSLGGHDLRFAATNGHTLGEITHVLSSDLIAASCIVPRETIAFLKWMKPADENISVEYMTKSERPDYIRFRCGDVTVLSKLIDGKFPDYGRVMPATFSAAWEIEKTSWLQAIARTTPMLVGSRINGAVAPIMISTDQKDRAAFTSRREDIGEIVIAAKAKKLSGGGLEFFCNAALLNDVLSAHRDAVISLEFSGPGAPMLFKTDGVKTVLMPMRGGFKAIELPEGVSA